MLGGLSGVFGSLCGGVGGGHILGNKFSYYLFEEKIKQKQQHALSELKQKYLPLLAEAGKE